MDAAAVMLAASLLSGEPEAVKCMAVNKGEVRTVPNAYDAGTCFGLAIVACTRDPNTIVRYKPRGTTTVYPPFRRCEARPYPGIGKQAVRVIEEAFGDRLEDAPEPERKPERVAPALPDGLVRVSD